VTVVDPHKIKKNLFNTFYGQWAVKSSKSSYWKKKNDARDFASALGTGVTCGGETGLCGITGCGTTG
jgi:hypothetical protein